MADTLTSPVVLAVTGATLLALSYLLYSKSKGGASSSDSASASTSSAPAETEVEDNRPKVNIFFGSQTGTAEGLAHAIKRDLESMDVRVLDLEDYDEADEVTEKIKEGEHNLFLMATYGEGEPTDNARAFVNLLKDGELSLDGAKFAVFGLGNTQYEFFNATGKFVDAKLEEAGGKRFVKMGLGDDDKSLEDDFEAWKDNVLYPALNPSGGNGGDAKAGAPSKPKLDFDVKIVSKNSKPETIPESAQLPSTRHYFTATSAKITTRRELRPADKTGSTLHIEVDVGSASLPYVTADNAGIICENDSKLVSEVASALKLNLDDTFKLSGPAGYKHPFPNPCTVRTLLSRYTDLTQTLRKSDLKALAAYCTDPLDVSALLRLSSKDGKKEYSSKIEDGAVGFGVLCTHICKSMTLSVAEVIAAVPRLQPRYYTISSSSLVHPGKMHMTVSVISGTNPTTKKAFTGVCTGHLNTAAEVQVVLRPSTFRLPGKDKPVVMIGPGTGIAPMRALLQERKHVGATGPNVLYFGCKREGEDYIYRDELEGYVADGTLGKLHLAFSREKKEKVYVQHLLSKNADEIKDLVEGRGGYVYVCGGTRMGMDVVFALKGVLGEDYVKKMQGEGRLVQELWA